MKINEAGWDRILRTAVGIVLLYLGFGGVVTGALGIVLIVLGFIGLITGLVGWCPIYAAIKFRTAKDGSGSAQA
ncbi:MAG TPA: DUF2892 domain-containing protein [Acidimicrobiia bacterium]|nr:DUF2892 domain-containing protein [Acidimicrobiia bacterium]